MGNTVFHQRLQKKSLQGKLQDGIIHILIHKKTVRKSVFLYFHIFMNIIEFIPYGDRYFRRHQGIFQDIGEIIDNLVYGSWLLNLFVNFKIQGLERIHHKMRVDLQLKGG